MAISVTCHSCGREYNVKDQAAGKKFKCKDCGEVVDVPGATGSDSASGGFEDDFGDPYDPYGTDMGGDVGAAPPPVAARRPKRKRGGSKAAAAERLKLPAIFLMILVCLSFLNHAAGLVMHFMGIDPMGGMQGPPQNQAEEIGRMVGGVIGGVFGLTMDLLVFIGAISMLRVGSYGLSMTAAIISVIPCASPCCILGIPFGIWSLVVLNDDAVKAGFR